MFPGWVSWWEKGAHPSGLLMMLAPTITVQLQQAASHLAHTEGFIEVTVVATNVCSHVNIHNVTILQLTLVRDAVADHLRAHSTARHSTAWRHQVGMPQYSILGSGSAFAYVRRLILPWNLKACKRLT